MQHAKWMSSRRREMGGTQLGRSGLAAKNYDIYNMKDTFDDALDNYPMNDDLWNYAMNEDWQDLYGDPSFLAVASADTTTTAIDDIASVVDMTDETIPLDVEVLNIIDNVTARIQGYLSDYNNQTQ